MSVSSSTKITVRFDGDVKELQQSLAQAAQMSADAGDKIEKGASGGIDKLDKKTSAFAATAKAAFAGVAAAAVFKFGKDAIAAFQEAEQAQLKLEDAFSRFPGLANTNIDALRALNEEIMRKTGIDDDQLATAQANLAAFGLTGQQIQALTPLVADYSAKTGKDVVASADALGKAVLGQGKALKAVGIDFTNTGTKSGNLQQIFDKLGPSVGGLADKMGNTAAGKAKRLQQQFGELQEKVGSKLVPVISTLTGFVLALVDGFSSLPGPIQVMLGVVVAAIAIMLNWEKITKAVKAAQLALNTALKANPIILIVSLIAALITALVYAYQHSEKFRKAINDAFRSIAPVVGTVIGYVVGYLSTMVKMWTAAVTKVLDVASHLPIIGDKAAAARDAIAKASKGITDKMDEVAVSAKDMTVEFGKNLSDKLPADTKKGTDAASLEAKKFADNLDKTGQIAGDNLGKGIKKKSGTVKKAVKDVVEEAKKQLEQFTNDVQDILGSTSAKRALAKAEKDLNALYAEQAGLGDKIAQAQLRINRAREEGAKITAEEQVAIEDAQRSLDDARAQMAEYTSLPAQIAQAQEKLTAVQGNAEASASDLRDAEQQLADLRKRYAEGAPYSPARLQVLEDKLAKAKSDSVAPTDDLKDAEQELADLRAREVEIQEDIADANQKVIDKTFALVEAQQKADAAQADLAKNGKNLIDFFTKLGIAAGLSAEQIDRVVSGLQLTNDAATNALTVGLGPLPAITAADIKAAEVLTTVNPLLDRNAERVINNNFYVSGSVVTQEQLMNEMRSSLLYGQYYGKAVVLP